MPKKITKKTRLDSDKTVNDRIDGFAEVFDKKFKIVIDQFKSVFEKLDNLSMDMTEIKFGMRDVPFQIKFLRDSKLDKKHFVDLDQRVRRLEKK